jgi:hypothetical protein
MLKLTVLPPFDLLSCHNAELMLQRSKWMLTLQLVLVPKAEPTTAANTHSSSSSKLLLLREMRLSLQQRLLLLIQSLRLLRPLLRRQQIRLLQTNVQ